MRAASQAPKTSLKLFSSVELNFSVFELALRSSGLGMIPALKKFMDQKMSRLKKSERKPSVGRLRSPRNIRVGAASTLVNRLAADGTCFAQELDRGNWAEQPKVFNESSTRWETGNLRSRV
jgi:hypothetical protein